MSTFRWIALGTLIGLVLALSVGFSFSDRSTPAPTSTDGWEAMEAMHDSPAMRHLHDEMPAELRAQCDAMHEQMEQMMSGGMMSGAISSHHPAGGMGGAMGSGPGAMMGG